MHCTSGGSRILLWGGSTILKPKSKNCRFLGVLIGIKYWLKFAFYIAIDIFILKFIHENRASARNFAFFDVFFAKSMFNPYKNGAIPLMWSSPCASARKFAFLVVFPKKTCLIRVKVAIFAIYFSKFIIFGIKTILIHVKISISTNLVLNLRASAKILTFWNFYGQRHAKSGNLDVQSRVSARNFWHFHHFSSFSSWNS